jgi:hypothetical protein
VRNIPHDINSIGNPSIVPNKLLKSVEEVEPELVVVQSVPTFGPFIAPVVGNFALSPFVSVTLKE